MEILFFKYSFFAKKNWFEACNKEWLSEKNDIKPFNGLFPSTTFITSNIFGFTKLNAENIVKHYNKVFSDKIDGVVFVKSGILKFLLPDGEKNWWEMEYLNYKSKRSEEVRREGMISDDLSRWYQDDKLLGSSKSYQILSGVSSGPILKGLSWKKRNYLLFLNNILSWKKQIFENFINNFDKIQKEGLIRAYFFNVSGKFNQFLQQNNFQLVWDKNKTYLFFYNLGFNKNSKFVDHLVDIDWKIYLNPTEFQLSAWLHKIQIKNIFRLNPFYENFLKQKKVPKSSYLWSKSLNYKNLLILQKNCKLLNWEKDYYEVLCN